MKDIILITISTRDPSDPHSGTMAEYLNQLAIAGIDTHVEKIGAFANQAGGGTLGGKVAMLRQLTIRFSDYERIIFSDAFDVRFYGSREDVVRKVPFSHILCAAERNCYPEPHLASSIPGEGPWKYINGGLLCGTPSVFLGWLHDIETHPAYDPNSLDQAWFNRRLAEQWEPLVIDSRTELFYCCFMDEGEIDWDRGLPVNTKLGTRPQFIHGNGSWAMQDIMARRERSLK